MCVRVCVTSESRVKLKWIWCVCVYVIINCDSATNATAAAFYSTAFCTWWICSSLSMAMGHSQPECDVRTHVFVASVRCAWRNFCYDMINSIFGAIWFVRIACNKPEKSHSQTFSSTILSLPLCDMRLCCCWHCSIVLIFFPLLCFEWPVFVVPEYWFHT